MTPLERRQVEFILKVVRRYKSNGGYVYKITPEGKRVRVSLAAFILFEVGAFLDSRKKS